ncbi:MAG: hypothetical protein P1U34_09170 [Coxiellaceae bacterium]|nr:hypothetical protein [Coxiellaceae bacterium]
MFNRKRLVKAIKSNVAEWGLDEVPIFQRLIGMLNTKQSVTSMLKQFNDDSEACLAASEVLPQQRALMAAIKAYLEAAKLFKKYPLSFLHGFSDDSLVAIGQAVIDENFECLIEFSRRGNIVAQSIINKVAFERERPLEPPDCIDGYMHTQRATSADQQSLCALSLTCSGPFAMRLLKRILFRTYTSSTLVVLACDGDYMVKSKLRAEARALLTGSDLDFIKPRVGGYQPCIPVKLLVHFDVKDSNTGLSPHELRAFSVVKVAYKDMGFVSIPSIEELRRLRWDDTTDPGRTIKWLLDGSGKNNYRYVNYLSGMLSDGDADSDKTKNVIEIMREHAKYYPYMDILDDILTHGSYALLCYYADVMYRNRPDAFDDIVKRVVSHFVVSDHERVWTLLCNNPHCETPTVLLAAKIKYYQNPHNPKYAYLYCKQLMAIGKSEVGEAQHYEILALAKFALNTKEPAAVDMYLNLLSKVIGLQAAFEAALAIAQEPGCTDDIKKSAFNFVNKSQVSGVISTNVQALDIAGTFYREGIGCGVDTAHMLALQLHAQEGGSRGLALANNIKFCLMLIGASDRTFTVEGLPYVSRGYAGSGVDIVSTLIDGYIAEKAPEQAPQWRQVREDLNRRADVDTVDQLVGGAVVNFHQCWSGWRGNHLAVSSLFMLNGEVYLINGNRGLRSRTKPGGLSFFHVGNTELLQTKIGVKKLMANCHRQVYSERTDPTVDDGVGKDLDLDYMGTIVKSNQKGGTCAPVSVYNAILSHLVAKRLQELYEGKPMPDGLTMAMVQSAFDDVYYPIYKSFRTYLREKGMHGIMVLCESELSSVDRDEAIACVEGFVSQCLASDDADTVGKGRYLAQSMREIFKREDKPEMETPSVVAEDAVARLAAGE